ncbi:MAG: DUF4870 domain-containing protein [Moorea sp. SIO2B7]|nr:DUF4870 domain-containing protein [Moorena sp. SIO2B7]
MNTNLDRRKLLSALCHGSIFFSSLLVSIVIPILIMFISDDSIVQENAKESLNFYFNIWLYEVIFFLLIFIVIGIPLLFIVIFISWLMPIIAIVKVLTEPDKSYRYPCIFRLL